MLAQPPALPAAALDEPMQLDTDNVSVLGKRPKDNSVESVRRHGQAARLKAATSAAHRRTETEHSQRRLRRAW